MNFEDWQNRYKNRNDISSRLTHLTKGDTVEEAFATLLKILDDKKLIGSTTETGFIVGKCPAVCFQEAPLSAIAENLLYEKQINKDGCKPRYNSFGLRFNKRYIYKRGGRPVIYENRDVMKAILPEDEYWRIVNYDLSNPEMIIDWTHEREWRVPGNLEFDYKDIEIVVASNKYYKKLIEYCTERDKMDILKEINGVVVMNTIFY